MASKVWKYVSHYKTQEHLNMGSNKPDVWQDVEVNGRMISIARGAFTWATLLPHNMGVCELVDAPAPVPLPDVLDAMHGSIEDCLDALVAAFEDDANNMPDRIHDSYMTVRLWLDELAGAQGKEADP